MTGIDFLVKAGDTIDIVTTQSINVLQETADSAANTDENAPPRFEPIPGLEAARSVKAILQDKRVLYVSATRAQEQEPIDTTGRRHRRVRRAAGAGRHRQRDHRDRRDRAGRRGDQVRRERCGRGRILTAIVRNAEDDAVEETLGITIDQRSREYGLRIPNIVEQLNEEAATP